MIPIRLVAATVVSGLLASTVALTGAADVSLGAETSPLPSSSGAEATQPWIAYSSGRAGESTWLVHPDGTGDHQVDAEFPGDLILPDWSPDGRRLAMTSRATGGAEPVYEYDLATGTFRQLFVCEDPCVGDDEPAYSRDGTRVVVSRALGPFTDTGPSDCGVWIGDLASGEVTQITSNPGCDREYFPRWSPDGTQLTYWRWRQDATGATTGMAVFVMDADGTDERQLTEWADQAGEPDWSPDGEWIVYSTFAKSDEVSNLYRMRPDGSDAEQLTFITSGHQRWFVHAQGDVVVPVEGRGGFGATQPRFTPDGTSITFTAELPGALLMGLIPAEGGEPYFLDVGGTHWTWQPEAGGSGT